MLGSAPAFSSSKHACNAHRTVSARLACAGAGQASRSALLPSPPPTERRFSERRFSLHIESRHAQRIQVAVLRILRAARGPGARLDVVGARSEVQRRPAVHVLHVGRRARLEQQLDHRVVPRGAPVVQRGHLARGQHTLLGNTETPKTLFGPRIGSLRAQHLPLVRGLDVRLGPEQRAHALRVPVPRREVQRRPAVNRGLRRTTAGQPRGGGAPASPRSEPRSCQFFHFD